MAGAGEVARSLLRFPSDAGSWTALAVGVTLIALPKAQRLACFEWLTRVPRRQFAICAALTAATLSALYLHYVLGGAARIIDATTYLLEARLLAQGKFSFAFDGPLTAYNGRFLVLTPDQQLAPIFPPGYPALLALGVVFGHPMWLGPLLAALIVLAVYKVGLSFFEAEASARMAALFSVFSAAQRYHTADSMSHGLCALLFLGALYGVSRHCSRAWLLTGVCLGWLVATRPATALAAAICCAVTLLARGVAIRAELSHSPAAPEHPPIKLNLGRVAWLALGAIPGIALLLCQQKAVTGHWFDSIQYLYYARSDTPENCFRYGVGANIGCRFEHGDFLQQYMPQGYGLRAALGTTGRRLAAHLCDAANLEIFTLFLPLIVLLNWKRWSVQALGAGLLLQVLAYAPFYFDGNYLGGGARMFADVLPLEQLLLGAFFGTPLRALQSLGVSLIGLVLHASSKHYDLKAREGGRPLFESALLNSVSKLESQRPRLLFVDSDHGFNLATLAHPDWRVARYRGDQSDWDVYQALGKPTSYRYLSWISGLKEPRIEAYLPRPGERNAGASFWPLSEVKAGSVLPVDSSCLAGTRGLQLQAGAGGKLTARLDLWLPRPGSYALTVVARGKLSFAEAEAGALGSFDRDCLRIQSTLQVKQGGLVPIWLSVTGTAELSAVETRAVDLGAVELGGVQPATLVTPTLQRSVP